MPSHRFFLKMAFNTIFPIFLSNPALEVGIPVSRANFCLACVIPSARFKENETPGILNFDINYNYFQYSLTKTVPILYSLFQHLIGTKQNVPTKYSSSIVAGYNSKFKNPS